MKINFKQKTKTVIDHVKAHPIPYAIALGAAAVTITRFVYDYNKGAVYLNDVTKDMTKTGKGVYFRNTKTGVTVIACLYNPETMPDLKFLD